MVDDEYLVLTEDEPEAPDSAEALAPWLLLVVDDVPDVIDVTRRVLDGCDFQGRRIELLSAGSAAAARRVLRAHPEVAVALIDVVMETDDAGLRLVTAIRDDMGMRAIRIILRTGQPGFAPERTVISQYDINDYRLKSELTAHSLYTAVVAALRGYAEIDARLKAEQEVLLAARSKAQFLANLSHELRTPLNAIIGFSEVIAQEAGDGAAGHQEFAVAIRDNGQLLLTVLNALLEMAGIDAGRHELRQREIRVDDMLALALAAMADRAAAAGVTIAGRRSPEVPTVFGDSAALGQILDNLLANAVKFSRRGGVVELSVSLGADGRPVIAVADRGIGIPAERLRDLFQPFTQLDARLARHFEGIGLGLAIVKGLVDLHGGAIEVASSEGEGTIFTVRLPADRRL